MTDDNADVAHRATEPVSEGEVLYKAGWNPTWIERDGGHHLDHEGHRIRIWPGIISGAFYTMIDGSVVGPASAAPLHEVKDAALERIGWVKEADGKSYSKRMVPRDA